MERLPFPAPGVGPMAFFLLFVRAAGVRIARPGGWTPLRAAGGIKIVPALPGAASRSGLLPRERWRARALSSETALVTGAQRLAGRGFYGALIAAVVS